MTPSSVLKKYHHIVLIVVLLLVAIPATAYYFSPDRNPEAAVLDAKAPTKQVNEKEVQRLVDKIGKLIELPKGELPTVATITDRFMLPPQPFYANAQNGDKLLIYTSAQKAYLYRPSTNKLVEVSPIAVETSPTAGLKPTPTSARGKSLVNPTTPRKSLVNPINSSQ